MGAFVLSSQYAQSGGWSQAYLLPSNYGRYITFNDGNFSSIVSSLFKLERETGDARYRQAALRGGECILKLQGIANQSIWALQFHSGTLEPAWARNFELPGYTPAESVAVCDTLVELFVETGDERYIESLGRALKWYETHKLENGKYARLYEPDTQRPVYGRRDKAVRVYDFTQACSGYSWQGTWYPHRAKKAHDAIQSRGGDAFRLAQAKPKKPNLEKPSMETIAGICDRLTTAGHWTQNQNTKQLATYEKHGVDSKVPMILLRDFNTRVSLLLDYIEATQ